MWTDQQGLGRSAHTGEVSTDDLEGLSSSYELAEAAFLEIVRADAQRRAIGVAARRVAIAASAFNAAAHRKLHAGDEDVWMPLDLLTERTELLTELWEDIASAYEA